MIRIFTVGVVVFCAATAVASWYEGNAFPEEEGWIRQGSETALRDLDDGWLVQEIQPWYDPPVMNGGDSDYYLQYLAQYQGAPFFAEWRMMSDAPPAEVDHHNGAALMVLVGGPVTYHFNVANGLVQFYTGYFPNLYFNVEPDVLHTYRLEVSGADWFEFYIDGVLVAADVPEADFPTPDARMSFGGRYHLAGHTTRWDYVRYGAIPEPATELLLLAGAGLMVARRRRWRA